MNKRGQFFLLAAIILAGILIGLGAVYTSVSSPKENAKVVSLKDEINFESGQVIDSGIFQSKSSTQISENVNQLGRYYSSIYPDNDLVVCFGDFSNIGCRSFQKDVSGSVGISTGAGDSQVTQYQRSEIVIPSDIQQEGDTKKVTVSFSNNTYDFSIKNGQNYFIIVKNTESSGTFVSGS